MIKPQDVLVVVQLAADRRHWTIVALADALRLPHANVQRSLERCRRIGFFAGDVSRIDPFMVEEFLVHAVRFEFPPEWTGTTKGVATAWSAPPLMNELHIDRRDAVVWPVPGGPRRGRGLQPLHPVLPELAKQNSQLIEWLGLVDAIRAGRSRDRSLAQRLLGERIDASLAVAA